MVGWLPLTKPSPCSEETTNGHEYTLISLFGRALKDERSKGIHLSVAALLNGLRPVAEPSRSA
jgi:hypothetical protein